MVHPRICIHCGCSILPNNKHFNPNQCINALKKIRLEQTATINRLINEQQATRKEQRT
jgi:hypothetical protein